MRTNDYYDKVIEQLCTANPVNRCKYNSKVISGKIKDIKLPVFTDDEKRKFQEYKKKTNFEHSHYGLAKAFWQLNNIIIDSYSNLEYKKGCEEIKVKLEIIMLYLYHFHDYYFKLVHHYLQRKYNMRYAELDDATEYLEYTIKPFISRYKFLFTNADEIELSDEDL